MRGLGKAGFLSAGPVPIGIGAWALGVALSGGAAEAVYAACGVTWGICVAGWWAYLKDARQEATLEMEARPE